MKNLIIVLFVFCLTSYTQNEVIAQSGRDEIEVKVEGLGCPFCAYGLEKKFKEFKGIKNVKIEMETGDFSFTYPADKKITVDQIETKVDDAGYTAVATQIIRTDGTVEKSKIEEEVMPDVVIDEESVIETSIFVGGNCGMCEKRIEKTASRIPGVVNADWDKDTQMLALSFDNTQVTQELISEAVAASGHDTKTHKAADKKYKKLPPCCHYDRVD